MTIALLFIFLSGVAAGVSSCLVYAACLTRAEIRRIRAARLQQHCDDAAFGPGDHPLDQAIDQWRQS